MTIKMVNRSSPAAPQHAARVRVVHHHDAAVLFRQVAKRWQRSEISIHRKHAVRNNQFLPRKIRMLLQNPFAVLHILVLENFDRRFRKPPAVNNRRVIQLIRNNQIFLPQHCRYRSRVRRKSRLKHHARFDILEFRNLLFQLHVQLHRSSYRSHRSRAHSQFLHPFNRSFP